MIDEMERPWDDTVVVALIGFVYLTILLAVIFWKKTC